MRQKLSWIILGSLITPGKDLPPSAVPTFLAGGGGGGVELGGPKESAGRMLAETMAGAVSSCPHPIPSPRVVCLTGDYL